MFILIRSIKQVFLTLLLSSFVTTTYAGNIFQELLERKVMRELAGTYVSPEPTADLNESLIWVLSADGTCLVHFIVLDLNPINATFTNSIAEGTCGWEVLEIYPDKVDVGVYFIELAQDPDRIAFQQGQCEDACFIYGLDTGFIKNGVFTYNETTSFLDNSLNTISSEIFGPFLVRPTASAVKIDRSDVVNYLESINAPLPEVPAD